jgi:hypothetical protein
MTVEQTIRARKNLEAVFAHYGLPPLQIAARFDDRCFWYLTDPWLARLRDLTLTGKFRSWDAFSNHGVMATASFRENVPRYSMQIVIHGQPGEEMDRLVEADIDRWNPDYGAGVALVHFFADVLGPTSDPFNTTKALQKRGIEV